MTRLAHGWFLFALAGALGCGSDFAPPAAPDARVTLDLAIATPPPNTDGPCVNTACGGCSTWTNWDGTPAKVGDPCGWNGVYQCTGTNLGCSSTACPGCSGKIVGSVCGADGHTILDLTYAGATCSVLDFGSPIAVCNRGSGDHCVARCATNVSTGNVECAGRCVSEDGGATGCTHQATETCDTLKSC